MILITINTSTEQSEITLRRDEIQLASVQWLAHRQLADTIHVKIKELLASQQLDWASIQGIVVYKGPGSFTGLRIGATVANALALGLSIPIVATTGNNWIGDGIAKLLHGDNDVSVVPEYGSDANITLPKK